MRQIVSAVLLALCLSNADVYAQIESIYPQNYFRSPLGIPLDLSANFGDLRSNHFHMGLDIRTQARENLEVYAAAEGYVSRIKIEKWGYGKAIYITHPNGYTTLYAHLNAFYKPLQDFLVAKQYADEQWEQDVYLQPDQFPVTKGQFIALSGNTGGSAGPHLHFEIRDSKTENNINPELCGLNIPDNVRPAVNGLYWYDRRYSTYLAAPQPVALKATGAAYTSLQPVVQVGSPLISLGVKTLDRRNNSSFRFGIYQAELWMDDSLINAFQLNDFSYPASRYINACTDYTVYARTNSFIQHLAKLPGNDISIFSDAGATGVIILHDTMIHKIKVALKDVHNNASYIEFNVQHSKKAAKNYTYPVNARPLMPGIADSITGKNVKAYFSKKTFYDVVPFQLSEAVSLQRNAVSPMVSLHNYTVPLHDSIVVKLKPVQMLSAAEKDRVVIQLISNRHKEVAKGEWKDGWMSVKFNRLGLVQMLLDTVPPLITPVGWGNGSKFSARQSIRLRCTDEYDEVESFTATLDGQWLLFAKKNDDFIYSVDDYFTTGKHTLKVVVTDKAGNVNTKEYTLVR
ncbi:M23 family metallopeptidase [Panacibacter sp. DH6]|uniref:M23 family metallopeptidase n=1 Tax=Panacibacter microcysteis TaxID=2793269 RepID=A0A931E6R2_9BACT|nr:peptidoglycan DD-metalloendopeptidase family protein [Panacibacter microcysteis]MBG9375339.1 M23 family metallopeptidase [Panacibacter microcysteis]